ncbi:hypothetical protein [Dokdonella soli]|uniref:Uncharacterized protein n=1 Tax=Dokdonella soli TaxID=529810 RepID=A0ABP3TP97_9GAMM
MKLRLQLVRAISALVVIGGIAAAETYVPPLPVCPQAKSTKPQRILLLDPVQKTPTLIDARLNLVPAGRMHAAAEQAADARVAGVGVL